MPQLALLRDGVLAAALLAALLALELWPSWRLWQRQGYDVLTALTAPRAPQLPITVVGIDEASFAELGRQWPWPRGVHGYLIEQLQRAGAALIAFDVVFAEPAADPQEDRLFAAAVAAASAAGVPLVLAAELAYQETVQARMRLTVEPLPQLLQAGALSGQVGVAPDRDQVVRRLPTHPDAFWRQILSAYRPATGDPVPELDAAEPLLRYSGPAYTYPYVSYYQALLADELLPPGSLKGRIVLIGLNLKTSPELGLQDDRLVTPFFSQGYMSGVELHANIVASAAAANWLRPLPAAAKFSLAALTLLAAVWLLRDWRPLTGALATLTLIALLLGLSGYLFQAHSLWLAWLTPTAAASGYYLLRGAVAYLGERRQRRAVRQAFGYYVAPAVIEQMLAHPERLRLGGERRELTLLFTDLAGFTGLSERLAPEQVAQLLNRHLTEMTRVILRHQGTVDKFIGDAIMAFWGAPLDDPEQALRACRAAREMQAAMAELRAEFDAAGLPSVRMRIGIHSGPAIAGNMGAEDRFDYTAVGDSVNTAARLEGVNKLYGTELLLSGATASLLGDRLPLRPIDRITVSGKSRPIDVYTLDDDRQGNAAYAAAIAAYRARNWDAAANRWRMLLAQRPHDPIAALYLQRISAFRQTPPGPDWDGATALEKM